jgi:hypothetical protein
MHSLMQKMDAMMLNVTEVKGQVAEVKDQVTEVQTEQVKTSKDVAEVKGQVTEVKDQVTEVQTEQVKTSKDVADLVASKQSTALSRMTVSKKDALLSAVEFKVVGAFWESKPALVEVPQFAWSRCKEDEEHQRSAYTAFISLHTNVAQFPDFGWYDAQPSRELLNCEIGSVRIKGTCDVVLLKKCNIDADAIRDNLLCVVELKKQVSNNHVHQAVGEHIAASLCSSDEAVVTVLTDLKDSWQFWWLSINGSSMLTYKATRAEGWWLLSGCIDSSVSQDARNSFPQEFLERSTFKQCLSRRRQLPTVEEKTSSGDGGSDDDGDGDSEQHSPGDKENSNRSATRHSLNSSSSTPMSAASASSSSTHTSSTRQHSNGEHVSMSDPVSLIRELYGYRDVADQLDLIDMVGAEERFDIIKNFVLDRSVPKWSPAF